MPIRIEKAVQGVAAEPLSRPSLGLAEWHRGATPRGGTKVRVNAPQNVGFPTIQPIKQPLAMALPGRRSSFRIIRRAAHEGQRSRHSPPSVQGRAQLRADAGSTPGLLKFPRPMRNRTERNICEKMDAFQ